MPAESDLARIDVCFSAAAGLGMTDVVRTAAFSAEHLILALRAGEPMRIARGFAYEMALAPGAGEEGLRWARSALPIAERLSERSDDPYLRGLFFVAQGYVAYFTSGEWAAAADWLRRADAAFRTSPTTDIHWALQSSQVVETHATAVLGDILAVEARLPRLLREARQRGDMHSLSLFLFPGVLVHLARDRVDAARVLLRETARDRPAAAFDVRDFEALHCALLVDRYEGRTEEAWTRIAEQWDAVLRSKILGRERHPDRPARRAWYGGARDGFGPRRGALSAHRQGLRAGARGREVPAIPAPSPGCCEHASPT